MSRTKQFYTLMLARNVLTDQDERREVARLLGYPGRGGIAAFFGGRYPSMVRLADGSSVLTEDGRRRARSI
jgi:hypothetical protein